MKSVYVGDQRPIEGEGSFRLGPAEGAVLAIAAARLLLHLLTASRYGIFRDEMYGIACAEHLSWGYVEHPPGGIVVTWLAEHLFGRSLFGLRLLPALAGAALIWLTARLAAVLGGGGFAQILAALAVCFAPVWIVIDSQLMMNAFEPLIWLACLGSVVRANHRQDQRPLLWFGIWAGIGVEFKYTILLFVVGVLAGLALSSQRVLLKAKFLWLGLGLGALLALPNFLWQANHGFPFLEYLRDVRSGNRDIVRGPVAFLADQASIIGPLAAPIYTAGFLWFLFGPDRKRYAVFGWTFIAVVGGFILLHGKNYYAASVYPVALAGGAVALERFTRIAHGRWIRISCAAALVTVGLLQLPLVSPILSPENAIRYQAWLGWTPISYEHQNTGPLPQYFADEFGWEDMVREVARVYVGLTPADRAKAAIFSNNWAEAAAVDFYGAKYGLPRAISKHNSYWLWGTQGYTGEVMIMLHDDGKGDPQYFGSIQKVGRVQNPYSRRDEWFDIYLCRNLKTDLVTLWPAIKSFD